MTRARLPPSACASSWPDIDAQRRRHGAHARAVRPQRRRDPAAESGQRRPAVRGRAGARTGRCSGRMSSCGGPTYDIEAAVARMRATDDPRVELIVELMLTPPPQAEVIEHAERACSPAERSTLPHGARSSRSWHWIAPSRHRDRRHSYYLADERVLIDPIAPTTGRLVRDHGPPSDVVPDEPTPLPLERRSSSSASASRCAASRRAALHEFTTRSSRSSRSTSATSCREESSSHGSRVRSARTRPRCTSRDSRRARARRRSAFAGSLVVQLAFVPDRLHGRAGRTRGRATRRESYSTTSAEARLPASAPRRTETPFDRPRRPPSCSREPASPG